MVEFCLEFKYSISAISVTINYQRFRTNGRETKGLRIRLDGHLELGGILLDSERVLRPSTLHAQLLAVLARRRESTASLLSKMRRHHAQYALLLLAATTLRAVYEYEGMVRSSSLAASLQSPRRLGCSVDDASFDAEAEKVMPIRYDPGGSHRPFSPRSALCGGIGRSRRAPHCVAVSAFVRDPKNATRRLMTTGRRIKREYGRRTSAPKVLPEASGT